MVICLIALAAGIRFSSLPEAESGQQQPDGQIAEALRHPQLLLGVVALFLYVGAEVIAADTIGLFGQSEHIPLDEARNFAALTLGAMVAGYFAGIALIPKVISQARALSISAIAGVVLTLLAVNLNGFSAVLCIALLGLANALMWPAIWPLALSGIGLAYHGYCWWGSAAFALWLGSRQCRNWQAASLSDFTALLFIYILLRCKRP
jgi:fucose permease